MQCISPRLQFCLQKKPPLQSHCATLMSRQETVYIWFDVFSCRQHVLPLQSSASLIEGFADVVKKAGSVAVVLHPFDDPLALKRMWCVFAFLRGLLKATDLPHALHSGASLNFTAACATAASSLWLLCRTRGTGLQSSWNLMQSWMQAPHIQPSISCSQESTRETQLVRCRKTRCELLIE